MTRKILWGVLVIGIALIVAPLAMGLPGKSAAGQRMMNDFEPIMQPANVQKTADYYYNTFTKLRPIALALNADTIDRFTNYGKGLAGMQAEIPKLVPALAQALHMTVQQVQQFLGKQFPAMAQMFQVLPAMGKDFSGLLGLMAPNVNTFKNVPPGLDHYKPLVDTMQGNVNDFKQINALPDFRLFTWFFVVPGILLVLLAGWSLAGARVREIVFHTPRPTPAH